MNLNKVINEYKLDFNYLVFNKKIIINKLNNGLTKVNYYLKEDIIYIYYKETNELLRAIYELFNFDFKSDFSFIIDFKIDISFMIDVARNGIYKLDTLKKLIRYISLMGYKELCIYLEDCFEVNNEPYFGYLRGRYSKNELIEIVKYASLFNIKVVPYIETLAHLNAIKYWPEYRAHFDIFDIVLIDDPRIYTLIENIISTIKEVFTSNEVHIGMDEAYFTGRGKYLDLNGYHDRFSLIKKHLDKVISIIKKYNLKPLMWSDMFFNSTTFAYQGKKESKINLDKDLTLVYWNYEALNKNVFSKHILLHKELTNNIFVAGGSWTWLGFSPCLACAIENSKRLIDVAIKNNIKKFILTSWGDNGSETPLFSNLPILNFVANYSLYKNSIKKDYLFNKLTDISFKDFMNLDLLNQSEVKFNYKNKTTINKIYLYNDLLLGKFDSTINKNQEMLFKKATNKLKKVDFNKEFGYIFKSSYSLGKVLTLKVNLGLELRKFYKENNKEGLKNSLIKLKKLKKYLNNFYLDFIYTWNKEKKSHGLDVIDLRIGGLEKRIETTIRLISEYLNNKITKIDELEEALLDFWGNLNEFTLVKDLYEGSYLAISTCNINW